MTIECPLCLNSQCNLYYSSDRKNLVRDYVICKVCDLIFVPEIFHISEKEQKARYLEHNNDPNDQRYRTFLSRLKDRITPFLNPGQIGLDYGSGPGPTLSIMMTEDGYTTKNYDPIFQPNTFVLNRKYEFVVSSETIEHFVDVRANFDFIDGILAKFGVFGVMTSIKYQHIRFETWSYHYDPTHVSFYSPVTMAYIASNWDWDIAGIYDNVYIYRKKH